MAEWHDIETAPRDGTTIRVKNSAMIWAVKARYGRYRSDVIGKTYDAFILVEDEDPCFQLPAGALVLPTHWQPLETEQSR